MRRVASCLSSCPFPMATTTECHGDARAQPPLPNGTALQGHPVFRTPLELSEAFAGTVSQLIVFRPVLLPSSPIPPTGSSQEHTLLNISCIHHPLRNCFLGNPTWETHLFAHPPMPQVPFASGLLQLLLILLIRLFSQIFA